MHKLYRLLCLTFTRKGSLLALVIAILAITALTPSHAQMGERMSFIRDAEIEYYLRELGTPIFKAASLDTNAVNLLIIDNPAINAFVAGGMNIFFFTGLLEKTDSPEELQGVLAHETGHIEGGHLIQGRAAMRNASAQAIIGMLAGVLAGLATQDSRVAIGAIGGAQSMAERSFLSYTRAQESAADTAAMRYMDSSGQSSQGLLNFMQKLAGQDMLPLDRQSEYVRTHPLSQDRVQSIEHHVQTKNTALKTDLAPELRHKHERMKAKLLGFLHPQTALLKYTDKDPRTEARYARAIALYRSNQIERALTILDGLIKQHPSDPFYTELKAQILFETGKIAPAVDLYKKAVELLPDSSLLHLAYGHALIESNEPQATDLAIQNLLESNRLEQRNPQVWRFLAAAWGKKAEKDNKFQGLVFYALAEESLAMGKDKAAKEYADRAVKTLAKGSPYWLRAQDIGLSVSDHSDD
jgi:predicted Zn-dependent protease